MIIQSLAEHVVLPPNKQVRVNLIRKDSNVFWAEPGEGSCLISAPLRLTVKSRASHQVTTKVTAAISPSLSNKFHWFCSDLKDALGNLWDLPLASSLPANFTRRLKNCNRKKSKHPCFSPLETAGNPSSLLQALNPDTSAEQGVCTR